MSTHLTLPSDSDLDPSTLHKLANLPKLNICRMLARTGILEQFYSVVEAIFEDSWFDKADRELMLFRVCQQNRSEYEISQHTAYGGFSKELIAAILKPQLSAPLNEWQIQLCLMCDEITREAKLSAESVQKLVKHYGNQNIAARAIFIMSWFNMLSRYVDSTGIPIEAGPDPYKDIQGPASVKS